MMSNAQSFISLECATLRPEDITDLSLDSTSLTTLLLRRAEELSEDTAVAFSTRRSDLGSRNDRHSFEVCGNALRSSYASINWVRFKGSRRRGFPQSASQSPMWDFPK